ncbi:MAG: group I truncated hemoglobin [Phycisphaerales bacterium]
MRSWRMNGWRIGLMACGLSAAGCGGGGEQMSTSGDPEADRRAEMRVGSDSGGGANTAPQKTLYERLGGQAGVEALVDDMTARVIADPRVNFDRRNVSKGWLGGSVKPWEASPGNIERFKLHMVEFISVAAGGPAEYTGKDIRTVHKGMNITNSEFDAMVGDIKTSMERLKIGRREMRDLLAVIETTRKQVVEKQ